MKTTRHNIDDPAEVEKSIAPPETSCIHAPAKCRVTSSHGEHPATITQPTNDHSSALREQIDQKLPQG